MADASRRMALVENSKLQTPNSKLQIPNKFQNPNAKRERFLPHGISRFEPLNRRSADASSASSLCEPFARMRASALRLMGSLDLRNWTCIGAMNQVESLALRGEFGPASARSASGSIWRFMESSCSIWTCSRSLNLTGKSAALRCRVAVRYVLRGSGVPRSGSGEERQSTPHEFRAEPEFKETTKSIHAPP